MANRHGTVSDAMRLAPARDVHTRSDEDVGFDVHETQGAAGSDVGAGVQACAALGEQGAKTDDDGVGTARERPGEECTPQILTGQAGNEGKPLRGSLERPVAAENLTAEEVGEQDRK